MADGAGTACQAVPFQCHAIRAEEMAWPNAHRSVLLNTAAPTTVSGPAVIREVVHAEPSHPSAYWTPAQGREEPGVAG